MSKKKIVGIEKHTYAPELTKLIYSNGVSIALNNLIKNTKDLNAAIKMLFIIKDNKIKSTKLIERKSVINYKPHRHEYYLDRVGDTGDEIIDYNLEPAQKLVNVYNNLY